MREKISITIDKGILQEIDGVVDNIYIKNRSQAIEHLVRNSLGENRTAVILIGGSEEGLRLKEGLYSPLAEINGKPLVERAIRKLRDSGFKAIHVIARHADHICGRQFGVERHAADYLARSKRGWEDDSDACACHAQCRRRSKQPGRSEH